MSFTDDSSQNEDAENGRRQTGEDQIIGVPLGRFVPSAVGGTHVRQVRQIAQVGQVHGRKVNAAAGGAEEIGGARPLGPGARVRVAGVVPRRPAPRSIATHSVTHQQQWTVDYCSPFYQSPQQHSVTDFSIFFFFSFFFFLSFCS